MILIVLLVSVSICIADSGNCYYDHECSGFTNFCSGEHCNVYGNCVPRTNPCRGNTSFPYCNEDLNRCVECRSTSDCPRRNAYCDRQICLRGMCVNQTNPCRPPTPFCNETSRQCLECRTNSDCPGFQDFCNPAICSRGVCTRTTTTCPASRPICDEEIDQCVECAGAGRFCGGIAGIPCRNNTVCIDDPNDTCVPGTGADCGGICVCCRGSGEVCNAMRPCCSGLNCLSGGQTVSRCSPEQCIASSDCPGSGQFCNPVVCATNRTCVNGPPPCQNAIGCNETSNSCICPAGQVYRECGSACPATCDNPQPYCIQSCVPGCFCPAGTVLLSANSTTCVPLDQCPPRCRESGEVCNATRPCCSGLNCLFRGQNVSRCSPKQCIVSSDCPGSGQFCNPVICATNRTCVNGPSPCQNAIGCNETSNSCVCPAGQQYRQCGPACPATCNNTNPSCNQTCVPGCFCPAGTVLLSANSTTCVPINQCPQPSECITDRDCPGGKLFCGGQQCVSGLCIRRCNPCNGSTPFCDEARNRCVACLTTSNCPRLGLFCHRFVCRPASGQCIVTNTCPPYTICDERHQRCVHRNPDYGESGSCDGDDGEDSSNSEWNQWRSHP